MREFDTGATRDTADSAHFDEGKPPLANLPSALLYGVADVIAYGAQKYDMDNWRKGMSWMKLLNSTLRHVWAFIRGEDLDPESGKPHLAHAACDLGFLLEYAQTCPEKDDRYHRSCDLEKRSE